MVRKILSFVGGVTPRPAGTGVFAATLAIHGGRYRKQIRISMPKRQARRPLTQERLKELLDYNPSTGDFRWRVDKARAAKKGQITNSLHKHGYLRISVDCVRYPSHRLAFLYMTGEWPSNTVDHINGIRNDNRWENLRDVSRQVNATNKASVGKTSIFPGVCWDKRARRWRAQCRIDSGVAVRSRHLCEVSAYLAFITSLADKGGEDAAIIVHNRFVKDLSDNGHPLCS